MISKVFPIIAISLFSSMLGVGIIVPLLPLYADKMGATGVWIGVIFASFSISQMTLTPVFGAFSDRRGRKTLLCIGLISFALISLGYLWAHQVYQLIFVRLLHGAAGGMVLPIAQAYIGDLAPEGQEGKWIGYLNAVLYAGYGFGPVVGGVLTEAFGMNVTFYGMGGLNLIAFILSMLFLLESHTRAAVKASHSASMKQLITQPVIQGLLSVQVAYAMGRGVFLTFLAIFATSVAHLNPGQVGILFGANIVLMSFYQLSTGRLADRVSKKWLTVTGGIINIFFLALIPLFGNFWPLLVLFAIGSVGGAIIVPATSAITVEEGRKYGMGTALGIIAMGQGIGFAVGPVVGGLIADSINVSSVFLFAAGFGAIGLLLFAFLIK